MKQSKLGIEKQSVPPLNLGLRYFLLCSLYTKLSFRSLTYGMAIQMINYVYYHDLRFSTWNCKTSQLFKPCRSIWHILLVECECTYEHVFLRYYCVLTLVQLCSLLLVLLPVPFKNNVQIIPVKLKPPSFDPCHCFSPFTLFSFFISRTDEPFTLCLCLHL